MLNESHYRDYMMHCELVCKSMTLDTFVVYFVVYRVRSCMFIYIYIRQHKTYVLLK